MNRDEFRQHMNGYKKARASNPGLSYWQWKANRPQDSDWQYQQWRNNLPENLRQETDDYDLYGAYKAGMEPHLEDDGFYHLGSRDPYTGRILKTKNHPTYLQAIKNEIEAGYLPYEKDGWTYTKTYSPIGDLSGYSDGTDGIVDELKSNSRTTLTPEEQQYLLNKSKQRQRMSGAITPMFDIQDAADLTPIGDILTARDTYNAFRDKDYIKASAMLGLMLVPPALGKIAKEKIPSFVTAAADKINELRRRERRQKELDTKIFSQGIEDRNRIIEELYDTPGIWDRAYNADITYGTNYVDTYDNLINNYYSNYFNLPEPVRKDIGDAQAMMSAKPEAITRYNDEGIPASWNDFAYYINPSIENLDKALTRHEMGHYVDFNMSKSNNADRGNLMFNELRKDLSVDPNPLMPNKTDYFRQGTEQKSYMNTLRQFMFDNNMINRIDDQVTQKQIKEAINKLPSELKSVKAAYQQFKSPRKYTKWFNTIPLLGTIPFIYNYSQEKDSN